MNFDEKYNPEVEDMETEFLLEAVYRKYGFDFRDFSPTHIRRRVRYHLSQYHYQNIPALMHDVLCNEDSFQRLLKNFSINVSEMFRDPEFYLALQEKVFPVMRTYPFFKVWHAGCSSGEEVYSMQILLREHGMIDKAQIYATDFNEIILDSARDGIYPVTKAASFSKNYKAAGGMHSLSEYYQAAYEHFQINKELRMKVLFAQHNLATDSSFGEMQLVMCRNVFIYFTQELQQRVLELFYDSLVPGGFLCLGMRESLSGLMLEKSFELVDRKHRIYRKKYTT